MDQCAMIIVINGDRSIDIVLIRVLDTALAAVGAVELTVVGCLSSDVCGLKAS